MKWTKAQLARLREAYVGATVNEQLPLDELAEEFGRHKTNVCRKARELGLTDQRRRDVLMKKERLPRFESVEARRAFQSERQRLFIAQNGHPRGALGLRHSQETKAQIAESNRRSWADANSRHRSPEATARRKAHALLLIEAGVFTGGFKQWAGGKRADLGDIYFRSSWEANYARFLNWRKARGEISDWAYEAKTFVFERIKRGTTRYTPDFLVKNLNGSHEWHEVKGWMNDRSRVRLKRMAKYYPEERVVVIDKEWFRQASRSGLTGLIPNWESARRGNRV